MKDPKKDSKLEGIARKIQLLLKLAKGNTTEAEASAAMEKVQKLLADYNLSMADVESKGQTVEDGKRERVSSEKSAMYEYQRKLFAAVAEAHFCIYFAADRSVWNGKRNTTKKQHVLVGREANVVSARYMFEYLNGTIDKLANEIYPPPTNLSRSALSWKEGCAWRLCDRLRERAAEANQRQEAEVKAHAEANTGALILLSDIRQSEADLNNDFRFGLVPGTTAKNRAENSARWAAIKDQPQPEPKPLTEKERLAQEKLYEKYRKQGHRRNEQYWAKKDMNAFWAGHEKGADIGLDKQVHTTTKRTIGE